MLCNPRADRDMYGWRQSSSNSWSDAQWHTEQSQYPFLNRVPRNFVSGCDLCSMAQPVRLSRFVREPASAVVEVSARYMARWDCPSVFRLQAALLDARYGVLARFDSGVKEAPADYWDRVRHVFEPVAGVEWVIFAVHGKDSRFWAGSYGSKVTECCVRVLYDQSVMDEGEVVHLDAFRDMNEERGHEADRALEAFDWREGLGSRDLRASDGMFFST